MLPMLGTGKHKLEYTVVTWHKNAACTTAHNVQAMLSKD